jgi:hypothetical protein
MHGLGVKDGILQGVIVTPSHETMDIKFVGSPIDLMKVAMFLNLEPAEGQVEEMRRRHEAGEEGDGIVTLADPRGGFATLAPVDRASDMIAWIINTAIERGEDPRPFL